MGWVFFNVAGLRAGCFKSKIPFVC